MRIGVYVGREELAMIAVGDDAAPRTHRLRLGSRTLSTGYRDLLAETLSSLPAQPSAIVFEVSSALRLRDDDRAIAIRIAPRPPVDPSHELRGFPAGSPPPEIVHIGGGHTTLGDELAPLDTASLEDVARSVAPGRRYVITATGSRASRRHEELAAQIILAHARPASIGYSHVFASTSFAVRERTALLNSALETRASSLATALALVSEELVPLARLSVTTNDGGRVPLARLSVSPVHSAFSGSPTELIGAAVLCGTDSARIVVQADDAAFLGEVVAGVPTIAPQRRDEHGGLLATQSANLLSPAAARLARGGDPPLRVSYGTLAGTADADDPSARHTELDLRALGAACAPLADWANRVVRVGSAGDMEQALSAARARVGARLVAFGALPSEVRIVESHLVATTYQHPNVVSVRVRGVAGRPLETFGRPADSAQGSGRAA